MTKYLSIGFELDTAHEVKIPVFHMLFTGQTQLSGKCLTGDDLIFCADGNMISVKDGYEKQLRPKVLSMNPNMQLECDQLVTIETNGIKEAFELKTEDGSTVKLTGNHPVFTPYGWREIQTLSKKRLDSITSNFTNRG